MPLTNDMWIDLALTATGYLAAGALSMVMYSMFRRKTRPGAAEAPSPAAAPAPAPPLAADRPRDDVRYVGFGERAAAGEPAASLRRNRAEVLRLARGMLRTGATDAEIKAVLPVSDAELAVLNYERS
ncbi:MAG TPA: hypothetical protein PLR32_06870 [candidate division Zixibacteria bacterium]|nr:hypothetical protein [candidate division Zixibacteria bacterium]MDD4916830.1 hypothetical protein [candidate division Zixibacteria bacterium]HOD65168.1 hypothetical protein [candidate division Zixibacteria bacterium]HOZ07362.1 hypothetical protein [candidate division Zixibacteria bacterium]HPC10748.1 hypothetical protein [candidate division Zixibacteria bacterium]